VLRVRRRESTVGCAHGYAGAVHHAGADRDTLCHPRADSQAKRFADRHADSDHHGRGPDRRDHLRGRRRVLSCATARIQLYRCGGRMVSMPTITYAAAILMTTVILILVLIR